MKIKWLGHSCFIITLQNGTTILTDPVDKESGYDIGKIQADIVTVSHGHHDHSNLSVLSGTPSIIDSEGTHDLLDIKITGIPTWHDDVCGTKRGNNLMFLIEADGMRMLHAGDLGQLLDPLTLKAVGKVDMLFVPIGGVYTIDYSKALTLMNTLNPKITVPMHYRTAAITFKLCDIAPFLNRAADMFNIKQLNNSEFEISSADTFDHAVIIPDYSR